MKKLIIFIAFTILFTMFSCTPDEYETPTKQETKKSIDPAKPTFADGPGDTGTKPPPPPDI